MRKYDSVKYKFGWMSIFFSPFRVPIPIFYIGKLAIGTPYMLPRVWRKSEDDRYMTHSPRKIGFDFVPLGWKHKYDRIEFEWNPVWSFVFWKLQIAVVWYLDGLEWKSFITYKELTDRKNSVMGRIKEARSLDPNVWITGDGIKEDWFIKSLRKSWKNIFSNEDW